MLDSPEYSSGAPAALLFTMPSCLYYVMVKKYLAGTLVGLVALVIGIVWQWPDGNVHMVACDVGQGDGILIWKGSVQAVVDGGPDNKIIDCLSRFVPFWDRTIELVVLTHPEADHMTGLVQVLDRYRVNQLVTGNVAKDTQVFRMFKEKVVENQVPVHIAVAGEQIRVNGLEFRVVNPQRIEDERVLGARLMDEGINEVSVVVKLEYGKFGALLTGDIGSDTERVLLNSGANLLSNVLKVGHHGSRFSSSEEFLEAVKPAVALVSVGKNRYGHPTSEALERLKSVGARILRTDEEGDIEIISDGQRMWVK